MSKINSWVIFLPKHTPPIFWGNPNIDPSDPLSSFPSEPEQEEDRYIMLYSLKASKLHWSSMQSSHLIPSAMGPAPRSTGEVWKQNLFLPPAKDAMPPHPRTKRLYHMEFPCPETFRCTILSFLLIPPTPNSTFFPGCSMLSPGPSMLGAVEATLHVSCFARPHAALQGLPISPFPALTAVRS